MHKRIVSEKMCWCVKFTVANWLVECPMSQSSCLFWHTSSHKRTHIQLQTNTLSNQAKHLGLIIAHVTDLFTITC